MSSQSDAKDPGPPVLSPGFWTRFQTWFCFWKDSPGEAPHFPELETKLGYRFQQRALLANALLHRSQVHIIGRSREDSNERLEFLGDSVLGAVVSDFLYHRYPDHSEGDLTKMKSLLVCGARLAEIAMAQELGKHVLMSRSEAGAGGRQRPTILADATEAVLGAVFLDGGYRAAEGVIQRLVLADSEAVLSRRSLGNYKSRLQEIIQADHKSPPRYKIVSSAGPDHDRRFEVIVMFEGEILGCGKGTNKKAAEQEAAREALHKLETDS